MKRIGFAYNPTSEAAVELRDRAAGWARCAASTTGRRRPAIARRSSASCPQPTSSSCSAATARSCARPGPSSEDDVPLLGINVGKVGFLSKVEADELERVLAQLAGGRLHARAADGAARAGSCAAASRSATATSFALNDVVVARGSLARVVRLDVGIDASHLATFIADGLVVSSPTGSTGYSFSAGGPILDPTRATSSSRRSPATCRRSARSSSSPSQSVRCRIVDAHEALVSIDGREDIPLAVGDVVEVRGDRAADPARRARRARMPFWDLLRHKVELLPS